MVISSKTTPSMSEIINVVSLNTAFTPLMLTFSLMLNLPLLEKAPMNIRVLFSLTLLVLSEPNEKYLKKLFSLM